MKFGGGGGFHGETKSSGRELGLVEEAVERSYPEYSGAYPWSPFPSRRARLDPGPHKAVGLRPTSLPERDWYLIAKQAAQELHLAHPEGCAALRIVLVTVPPASICCLSRLELRAWGFGAWGLGVQGAWFRVAKKGSSLRVEVLGLWLIIKGQWQELRVQGSRLRV